MCIGEGLEGEARLSRVGLLYLFSGVLGHSPERRILSLSPFFASFFSRLSFSLASWMTCCAAVSGSFVGVRRFLAADHQEVIPFSRWEGVGEGVSKEGMDCERAGETC